jgi:hypothetical protein
VEIPASEYRAYVKTERPNALGSDATLEQKKAVLNDLINEYLWVDEAYRRGVDRTPTFSKKMEQTQAMLLSDFLIARDVFSKTSTTEEQGKRIEDLKNRLFDRAEIEVSNEVYAQLVAAARRVNGAAVTRGLGPVMLPSSQSGEAVHDIMDSLQDAILARYNGTPITLKQVLAIYIRLHAPRPALETQESLIEFLKPMILPGLLAEEARKRGLSAEPDFQNKLVENRNALLRFYVQGEIEAQANRLLSAPDLEQQLLSWYQSHRSLYASSQRTGDDMEITGSSELRDRVLGDYSVALRDRLLKERADALRRERTVWIDDGVLDRL